MSIHQNKLWRIICQYIDLYSIVRLALVAGWWVIARINEHGCQLYWFVYSCI